MTRERVLINDVKVSSINECSCLPLACTLVKLGVQYVFDCDWIHLHKGGLDLGS